MNLSYEDKYDLCAYSLCHNIALKKIKYQSKEYCELNEVLSQKFPFLTKRDNILKYQFEYFDQSGLYQIKGENIPLFSQIISFAKLLDTKFELSENKPKSIELLKEYIQYNKNRLFSKEICEAYEKASKNLDFYLDLQNENQVLYFIFSTLVDYSKPLSFEKVYEITSVFNELIDDNKNLPDSIEKMAQFYGFEHKDLYTLKISGTLVNLGKICVNDKILNKDETLDTYEYEKIKEYPYHTKVMLSNVIGFTDIAKWASCIQERLDSYGYPFGLDASTLSLKERLMINLVIYESLKTKKPYRAAFTHNEAIDFMNKNFDEKSIDKTILEDIKEVLR